MTSVSKWVAAGSSAAVLAGGLFIAAPATAAPGDAACMQASLQYEAALSAAGITETTIAVLEAAAENAATAEASYVALLEAAGAGPAAALEAAEAALETAVANTAAAEAALEAAQDSGDPDVLADAEAAKEAAEDAEDEARQAVTDASAAYDAAVDTPEILAAQDAMDLAVAAFENALAAVSLNEATAAQIMALFEAFLTACNPDSIGADPVDTPVVVPPAVTTPINTSGGPHTTTPAGGNPVSAAPLAGTTAVPVAGVNRGLNVQTSAAAEPADHPGLALLAGLLAAGIVVPAAVALRMRQLQRARR